MSCRVQFVLRVRDWRATTTKKICATLKIVATQTHFLSGIRWVYFCAEYRYERGRTGKGEDGPRNILCKNVPMMNP